MNRQQAYGLVAAGVVAAVAAGCATVGYDQAGKMSRNMQQTKQDVQDARSQVTATVTALDIIMKAQVGDLRPLVQSYSKNLATLSKMGEKAAWRAQDIRTSGGTYFGSWAQEIEAIQNPQVKANSVKRREQAMANYAAAEQALIKIRDAYKPVLKDLLDIEKALQQDLTPAGVAGVQSTYKAARQKAIDLQTQMAQSLAVVDRVVGDLAPTAAQ